MKGARTPATTPLMSSGGATVRSDYCASRIPAAALGFLGGHICCALQRQPALLGSLGARVLLLCLSGSIACFPGERRSTVCRKHARTCCQHVSVSAPGQGCARVTRATKSEHDSIDRWPGHETHRRDTGRSICRACLSMLATLACCELKWMSLSRSLPESLAWCSACPWSSGGDSATGWGSKTFFDCFASRRPMPLRVTRDTACPPREIGRTDPCSTSGMQPLLSSEEEVKHVIPFSAISRLLTLSARTLGPPGCTWRGAMRSDDRRASVRDCRLAWWCPVCASLSASRPCVPLIPGGPAKLASAMLSLLSSWRTRPFVALAISSRPDLRERLMRPFACVFGRSASSCAARALTEAMAGPSAAQSLCQRRGKAACYLAPSAAY